MTPPQAPLVSAQWLAANFEAPDLRIIDATWFAPFLNPPETGYQAYPRGYIPGAVNFDIDAVSVYNGSWTEWAASPDNPIETGPA